MQADLERLRTELAEERQWRQELADLSVDQQREIERLKTALDLALAEIAELRTALKRVSHH